MQLRSDAVRCGTARAPHRSLLKADGITDEQLVEAAALAEAEAMDDGSSVSLDAFKAELEGYSGKLVLRIPRSLHKHLKEEAEIEGVSLNQYMLYKLSR